jgi:hypothetical protein
MFIDEWFEKDYYKQLPLGYHVQRSYQPGQFFWTYLLYTVENLELWRAVGYSGEGEHRFRREAERHSGAKVNSSRSAATLTQ